jgi:antirestriction protein ArdC
MDTRPGAAQIILKHGGADVRIGGDRAFYSPDFDFIQLPPDHAFRGYEYWCAVAMHETSHATGHKNRMNRDLTGKFGSAKYAEEEIRADMATAFVCNTLNLRTDHNNNAAYIGDWIKKLKSDRREIFSHCR